MRTVPGRTDHVVIVGAGLSGLACALHLVAAGRQVTVVEREPGPGGRAGRLALGGYTFDTGPTVLTMPELLAEPLAAVGESLADRLALDRLDPAYRAHFPDGSHLDVLTDQDAMADQIGRLCGARDAAGYRRFVAAITELYRLQRDRFIGANVDSPLGLLRPELVRLLAMGGFGRLAPWVGRYVRDPRLRRVFTFQSLYAGLSPYRALALYAVIAYMDCVRGVYFPRGGMYAVPEALAAAAGKAGVTFRYGTNVRQVEVSGGRAHAVLTAAGERIPADVVVLTADLPVAYRTLLPAEVAPKRLGRLRYAPSCFLLHVGSRAAYRSIAHHNIHFGGAWRSTFSELIDERRLMSDPALLVTNPTRSDPDLAPPGRQTYYVLAPVPHLAPGVSDFWRSARSGYRDTVVSTLEGRGYTGFGGAVEVERTVTPEDWAAAGMGRGTPFAAAHTLWQTGPFRPANLASGVENVVFSGSGTVPGVGVPMVLVSGRLAAERITGQRSTAQRSTGQRDTGQRSTGQRDTGQRSTGQRDTGRLR
jgi:phytoene desaturase